MTKFVLVHGGWHGGWCWRRVARLLRDRGHEVFTPTLTGLGERSHLAAATINLDTHIEDVMAVIDCEDLSDVELVGHSYGGMVVTGVADRCAERIASLTYVDAFLPRDGDSLFSLTTDDFRPLLLEGAASTGGLWSPPIPAAGLGVNEADRAWVDARCRPHPFACFLQKISLSGKGERITRRTYVYADGWSPNPYHGLFERLKSDPGWRTKTLSCGHDVMVDRPRELSEILDEGNR